jgi:hypothetical protein
VKRSGLTYFNYQLLQNLELKMLFLILFQAVFAPAGTPQDVVNTLSNQCINAFKDADVIEKLKQAGGLAQQQLWILLVFAQE